MRFWTTATLLLLLTAACSKTEQAAGDARDANEQVNEEKADVQKKADELREEQSELREAQAEANAKAVRLQERVDQDTAARRRRP